MSAWGALPWENDDAADWFAQFMTTTNIRAVVMQTVQEESAADSLESLNRIRAAISVFILLGRNYIWPIDTYDDDLESIYAKAIELQERSQNIQWDALSEQLDREITELNARRSKPINKAKDEDTNSDISYWLKHL